MKTLISLFIISYLSVFYPKFSFSESSAENHTDYNTYLNRIIELQKRYAVDNEWITIPMKIYSVSPLIGANLQNEDFKPLFSYLNTYFASANIRFEQVAEVEAIYTEKDIDVFYRSRKMEDILVNTNGFASGILNLYIFDNYENVVGFTHYPNKNLHRIFIAKEKLLDPSLIHEMGHYFGLLHTFEQNIGERALVNEDDCLYKGDKICDTPADPDGASFLEDECRLYGEYRDKEGALYRPKMANFMSYYGRCRSEFSPQQALRIHFIAQKIRLPQLRGEEVLLDS